MNSRISLDQLIMDARFPDFAMRDLSMPDRIDWPDTWPELATLRKDVQDRLPETLQPLMDLSLAAHFLRTSSDPLKLQNRQAFLVCLDSALLPKTIFHGNSHWRQVPVAVVAGEKSDIHYFMVGAGGKIPSDVCWPGWLTARLDGSSQDAVWDAFHAAQTLSGVDRPLFMFPLIAPGGTFKIEGRSLGLPLCLGALSALTGETLSSNIMATGDVQRHFDSFPIGAVSDIPAKMQAAHKENIRLILVPRSAMPADKPLPGLMCRPVGDLKEAWLWARLYAPGREKDLEILNRMQSDPCLLVDNCLNVMPEMLEWLMASESGKRLSDGVMKNPGFFKTLVGKLDVCLASASRDLKQAAVIRNIVPDETLPFLKACVPLQAFKWVVLNLKRVNHHGDNDQSRFWVQTARSLQKAAKKNMPEEYSEFVNNLLVAYHNTYTFCPDPPLEFKEAMTEEEGFKRGGNSAVLGRMYGTLAQNYAFCGPAYLKETCHYVQKAQSEFDNGNTPEYREDWIREFSYLVFACLDAGRIGDARDNLWQYLQMESWNDTRQWSVLNPYECFVLVRYLADAGVACSDAAERELAADLTERLADVAFVKAHPAPLIVHNLGRLALGCRCPELAKHYFESSVKLCAQNDETIRETVRAMALLSLSGLYHAGLWTPEHETSAASVREAIRASRFLNQTHFKPLMEGDIPHMMERVWREPALIFPFSYR